MQLSNDTHPSSVGSLQRHLLDPSKLKAINSNTSRLATTRIEMGTSISSSVTRQTVRCFEFRTRSQAMLPAATVHFSSFRLIFCGASNSLILFATLSFGGLFIPLPLAQFFHNSFGLHFSLQHPKGLINLVIPDCYQHNFTLRLFKSDQFKPKFFRGRNPYPDFTAILARIPTFYLFL